MPKVPPDSNIKNAPKIKKKEEKNQKKRFHKSIKIKVDDDNLPILSSLICRAITIHKSCYEIL